MAVKKNDLDMLKMLLDLGASVDDLTVGEKMRSAMHMAAGKNRVEMMEELYKGGATVDLVGYENSDTCTPLTRAIQGTALDAIEWLLQHGANVDGLDENDRPLNAAAFTLSIPIVMKLIDHGANVNISDSWGNTPLMETAVVGSTEIAKLFVEHGKADLTKRNKVGATALDEAIRHEMWETAHYLWLAGCPCSTSRSYSPSSSSAGSCVSSTSSLSSSSSSLGKPKMPVDGISSATWIRPYVTNLPSPRYKFGFASIGPVLYVYGGLGVDKEKAKSEVYYNPDKRVSVPNADFSDFWKLDLRVVSSVDLSTQFIKSFEDNRLDETCMGSSVTLDGETQLVATLEVDRNAYLVMDEATNVRAMRAFAPEDGFGYYEATVEWLDAEGCVAIGLVSAEVDHISLPGWNTSSFGLHSDDARTFHDSSYGLQWGRRYYAGDTVGCGIDFKTQQVLFTLNGQFLGVAYRGFQMQEFYPCIGFRTHSAQIHVNFGNAPFLFDFQLAQLTWQPLPSAPHSSNPSSPYHLVKFKGKLLLFDASSTQQGKIPIFDPNLETWSLLHEPNSSLASYKNASTYYTTIKDTIYGVDAKAKYPTKSPSVWDLHISGKVTTRTILVPNSHADKWTKDIKAAAAGAIGRGRRGDADLAHQLNANLAIEPDNDDDTDGHEGDDTRDESQSEESDEEEAADDEPVPNTNPRATPISNLNDNDKVRVEMREKFSGCPVVPMNGKLCLLSKRHLGVFDPKTSSFTTHVCGGSNPVSNYFSVECLNGHLVTFGGWDDHHQRADLLLLNSNTLKWYQLHTYGVTPRPRSLHRAAVVEMPKDHPLLNWPSHLNYHDANTSLSPLSSSSPYSSSTTPSDAPLHCLAMFGGWSGHSHLNDLEILVPSFKSNRRDTSLMFLEFPEEDSIQITPHSQPIVHCDGTAPNSTDFGEISSRFSSEFRVIFRVASSKTGERVSFVTDAIVVVSRSAKIRRVVLESIEARGSAVVEVSAHVHLFRSLLTFLWDDNIDFDYDHDEARVFYDLVVEWAEEHAARVSEALLMNSLYKTSRWSLDLAFAVDNSLFSNIELAFGKKVIKAHKCILKMNPYFNQLFSAGMADSNLSTIDMTQHMSISSHLQDDHRDNEVYRLGIALITYIYTKTINLRGLEDDIAGLFQISDKYQVWGLKAHLEGILCFNLSESNVISIMNLAITHSAPRTIKSCSLFIKNHPHVKETEEFQLTKHTLQTHLSI